MGISRAKALLQTIYFLRTNHPDMIYSYSNYIGKLFLHQTRVIARNTCLNLNYSGFQIDELHHHNQNLLETLHATSLLWSTKMKTAVK